MRDDPHHTAASRPSAAGDPYLAAWRDLKRRRVACLALSFLPGPWCWITHASFPGRVVGFAIALTTFWALALRVFGFRCPRCAQFFRALSAKWWAVIEPGFCMHCGLPEGAPLNAPK